MWGRRGWVGERERRVLWVIICVCLCEGVWCCDVVRHCVVSADVLAPEALNGMCGVYGRVVVRCVFVGVWV